MPIPLIEQPITKDTLLDFTSSEERAELTRRWKTMRKQWMLDQLLADIKVVRQQVEYFANDEQDPQAVGDMEKRLSEVEWDLFYHMKSPDVVQLFTRDFAGALERPWKDVSDDIADVVLGEYSLKDRQEVKQKIVAAIRESFATIGASQIILGGESTDPTVANWLRDVRDFTGGTDPDALEIVEYLNGSRNAQSITDEEREQLEGVLKLIADLNIPSAQDGGYEDGSMVADLETGNYVYYKNGHVVDTEQAVDPEELEEIRKITGLNEDGTLASLGEQVKGSITESRYALPSELQDIVDSVQADEHIPTAPLVVESEQQQLVEEPKEESVKAVEPLLEQPVEMDTVPAPDAVEEMTIKLPPLLSEEDLIEEPVPAPVEAPKKKERFIPVVHVDESDSEPQPVVKIETPVPPAPEPELPPAPVMPAPPAPVPTLKPTPAPPAPQNKVEGKGTEQVDYNELSQRVLAEFNILFADFQQEKNFVSIVASYLRGVRDYSEAHEGLARSPEEGGVDLSVEQIDEVLETAQFLLNEEIASPQVRRAAMKKQQSAGPRPTLAMVQEKMKKQRSKEEENWNAVPVQKRDAEEGGVEDIFSNVGGDSTTELRPVAPLEMPTEKKLPVGDISKEDLPTVMGPMQELENVTLTEYRQYSTDPVEASHQILEKVALLAQESIQKKASGIEAWKRSPLNKLYVAIGNRSFNDAIPVEQAIAQMESEGERMLSQDEFHAIADMNRQLRF